MAIELKLGSRVRFAGGEFEITDASVEQSLKLIPGNDEDKPEKIIAFKLQLTGVTLAKFHEPSSIVGAAGPIPFLPHDPNRN